MPRNLSFWRNVLIMGVAHAALLFGLTRWSGAAKKTATPEVLWMSGGLADAADPVAASVPSPEELPTEAAPTPPAKESPVSEAPAITAPSVPETGELTVPTASPEPTPSTTPKPAPTPPAKPPPKAVAKSSPRSKIKAKPTPTPKKTLLAKAGSPGNKPKPTAAASPRKSGVTVTPANAPAAGAGTSPGTGGNSASASDASWYGKMLHDRFFQAWAQPTSVVSTEGRMSALVQVRIEQDGRVAAFKIVRSSGNVVVDESVEAVAKRIVQVDPLPAGLGQGGAYEVRINFELNAEE